jgi:hypothetical protein
MQQARYACLIVAFAVCGVAAAATAPGLSAPPKFALVIGNSDYPVKKSDLPNAVNDANLLAQSLKKLGFTVSQHANLGRGQMLKVVTTFASELPTGATALVFYAGHGMHIGVTCSVALSRMCPS